MMALGGVFERHPELKLVVAESDVGWLPHYMYRMDHAAKINTEGGIIKGLSKLPSEYIRSNVWATFQDDLTAYHSIGLIDVRAPAVGQRLPPHRLDLAPFPPADRRAGVAPRRGAHQAIFRDNTARLFNLPAGDRSWRMEQLATV